MNNENIQIKHLSDYKSPDYSIQTVDLEFDIHEEYVSVLARSHITYNGTSIENGCPPLVLDGSGLCLKSVEIDGKPWPLALILQQDESLTLTGVPEDFELSIRTEIYPQKNSSLEGLYKSSGMYCTQCEAEGFRKITYFIDRPDNLSSYSCKIIADREKYPVLLSNGDLVEAGKLDSVRHWATWRDPFKKPCYLFALVAGDLSCIEDEYTTRSGKRVELRVYVEHENVDKCAHAMESLKKSMRWDEEKYGLEYDLNTYMIVAVSDFNMGAMENKGLNIFNSKYVLANPATATDDDYEGIENVIGHEYFHNWTGNRVTCRDWFQLSLKEGLTVYRDQEFSADVFSRPVKRIQDVRVLRNSQFIEDSGPMAHPVRPESYIEINNFYTTTVYNKGAEVIRMYHTLFGDEGFKKGIQNYIRKFDGQAVTTDDFFAVMMETNGVRHDQFKLWYSQAGTPVVSVKDEYDNQTRTYTITMKQQTSKTPGQEVKKPFLIPVVTALFDKQGNEIELHPVTHIPGVVPGSRQATLVLDCEEKSFEFGGIDDMPVPSLLRGFSAPVQLDYRYDRTQLAFLAANDTDPFNRWDAVQRMAADILLSAVANAGAGVDIEAAIEGSDFLIAAYDSLLNDFDLDLALKAEALQLPSETYLAQQMDVVDVDGIHHAREYLKQTAAATLREPLLNAYTSNTDYSPYVYDAESAGKRKLKNSCLAYLACHSDKAIGDLVLKQYRDANNMTDTLAALEAMVNSQHEDSASVLDDFYRKWKHDALVMDKWLSIQARASVPGALQRVKQLMKDPVFDVGNPNKVRALIGAFASGNQYQFHDVGGSGYEFLCSQVLELDKANPQIAARLLTPFTRWRKFDRVRQDMMRQQLEVIAGTSGLSRDSYEIASKSLAE